MKNIRIEIKWSFIFVLMSLLWMLLEHLVGLHDAHIELHAGLTNLFAIPAILVYVFALVDKREIFYGGMISYKQAFISGLVISLIVAVLSPLSQYITSTIITPHYFENAIEFAVSSGSMDRASAEAHFNLNQYIIMSLISAQLMGIITTAIVALFVKKKAC